MKVFNLGKHDGEWETRPLGNDRRQFGFPSVKQPNVGDLVVIQRENNKVLYQIEQVDKEAIERYEDLPEYKFWTGKMIDVIATNSLSPRMIMVLKHENLA